MSSEAITRNDLTAILNEVLPNPSDMTPQEVEDFVDGLNISGINAVDYVVDQGTSGIWTYKKWASGMYEAWAQSYESFAMTNALGNTYYGNKHIDISSLGFVSIANCQVTGHAAGVYFGTKIETLSTTDIQLSARASNSNTAYITHHIQLIGTWK